MTRESYEIKLTGFTDAAKDPTSGLIKTFGISPDRADILLGKLPAIVKARATRVEALNYLRALKGIGAKVSITNSDTKSEVGEEDLRGPVATPVPIAGPLPITPVRSSLPPRADTLPGLSGDDKATKKAISKELADPFRVLREPDLLDLDALIAEVEAEKSDDEAKTPDAPAFAPAWEMAEDLFDRPSHGASRPGILIDPYGVDSPLNERELTIGEAGVFHDVDRDPDQSLSGAGSAQPEVSNEPFPLDSPWDDFDIDARGPAKAASQSVTELINDLYGSDTISASNADDSEPVIEREIIESTELDALADAEPVERPSSPPEPELEVLRTSIAPPAAPAPSPTGSDFASRESSPRSARFQSGEHSGTWGLELDQSKQTTRMPAPPEELARIPDFETRSWEPLLKDSERAAQSDEHRAVLRSQLSGTHKKIVPKDTGNKVYWILGLSVAIAAIIGGIVAVLLSNGGSELEGPLRQYRDTYLPDFEIHGVYDDRLDAMGETTFVDEVRRGNCYGWIATTPFTEICGLDLYLSLNGRPLAHDVAQDNFPVVFHCATEDGRVDVRLVNTSPSPCAYGLGRFGQTVSPAWPLEPYIELYVAALNSNRRDPFLRTGEIMHGDLAPGQRERREVSIPPDTCLTFLGISQQGTDLDATFWLDGEMVSEDNEAGNFPIVGACAGGEGRLGYIEFSMYAGGGEYVWQALDGSLTGGAP